MCNLYLCIKSIDLVFEKKKKKKKEEKGRKKKKKKVIYLGLVIIM